MKNIQSYIILFLQNSYLNISKVVILKTCIERAGGIQEAMTVRNETDLLFNSGRAHDFSLGYEGNNE